MGKVAGSAAKGIGKGAKFTGKGIGKLGRGAYNAVGGSEGVKQLGKDALKKSAMYGATDLALGALSGDLPFSGESSWEDKLGFAGDIIGGGVGGAAGGALGTAVGPAGTIAGGLGGGMLGGKIGSSIGKLVGKAVDSFSSSDSGARQKAVSSIKDLISNQSVDPEEILMAQKNDTDKKSVMSIFRTIKDDLPDDKQERLEDVLDAEDDSIFSEE